MKKIWQFIPQIIICLLAIVLINTGNAWGVTILKGTGGAEVFTKLDNCSEYDRLSSSYVSVYRNAAGFTASSHTYANDFEYFKQAYCGQEKINNNQIQAAECYKIDYNGTPKGKVVVADCAPSSSYAAKMYFYMAGGTISTGVNTTKPETYNAALEFVAQCKECPDTENNNSAPRWIPNGAGYEKEVRNITAPLFCNICTTEPKETGEYRCASNWYGTTNNGTSGCAKCPTGTNVNVSSTAGKNTQSTDCKYECNQGYFGTATNATDGCTLCPKHATCAGGNGSTYVCSKGYYNTKHPSYACQACVDVENYQNLAVCDNTGIKCKAGHYAIYHTAAPIMKSCEKCPTPVFSSSAPECKTASSAEGSIGINSCYLKPGCTYEDETGFFTYEDECSI